MTDFFTTTAADERYFEQQERFLAMTLAEYITFRNNQADERMAAEPGLWFSHYITDLAHWNEGGIYTAKDFMDMEDAERAKDMEDSYLEHYDRDPYSCCDA